MKRFLPVLLVLLIPVSLFAQGRRGDESDLLKGFGLNDGQITQVTAIEKSTRDAINADMTHIRLVKAQIDEALLPANPDAQAISALIDKKAQFRTDIEKQLMSARLQLTKIIGSDNFAKYSKFIKGSMRNRMMGGLGRGGQMMGRGEGMPMMPKAPGATGPDEQ